MDTLVESAKIPPYMRSSGTGVMEVSSLEMHDEALEVAVLVEMNQRVVEVIVENERDTWKNQELSNLVRDSLRNNMAQLKFGQSLGSWVNYARDSKFKLNVGLEDERLSGSKEYSWALQEIETSADALGKLYALSFQPIYEYQSVMSNNLQAKKFELDKKLGSIKEWRNSSNMFFVVTFTLALIILVASAATAAPRVLTALATAAIAALGILGKWADSIWKKKQNEVKEELNVIGSMELWTFILKNHLDSIRVLVIKLEIKMQKLLQNADFALGGGEAVELGVNEMKKELNEFAQEIEDLSRYTRMFNGSVERASTTLFNKMIAYPGA